MSKIPCYYTVVRFLEDPIKNEPRNIGVIIQCPNLGYINCRFASNLRQKSGPIITPVDIEILKVYIKNFTEQFENYAKPTNKPLITPEYLKASYLSELSQKNTGRLQFTEPKGCLTENVDKELEYLFKTFVGELDLLEPKRTRPSRLKVEMKQALRKRKLLRTEKDRERKPGIIVDAKVKGYSNEEFHVDFAIQNGRLFVFETVDLRKSSNEIEKETWKSIGKNADLKALQRDILGYSLVALPEKNNILNHYLNLLRAHSEVVICTDPQQKERFLADVERWVREDSVRGIFGSNKD